MKNIKEDGFTSLANKSCAAITLQCLVDAGITDWKTAFDRQIANAKKLGLMPDDFKIIRETQQDFGFAMQSTVLEGIHGKGVINNLGNLGAPAAVFLQMSDYSHFGGNMVAL